MSKSVWTFMLWLGGWTPTITIAMKFVAKAGQSHVRDRHFRHHQQLQVWHGSEVQCLWQGLQSEGPWGIWCTDLTAKSLGYGVYRVYIRKQLYFRLVNCCNLHFQDKPATIFDFRSTKSCFPCFPLANASFFSPQLIRAAVASRHLQSWKAARPNPWLWVRSL